MKLSVSDFLKKSETIPVIDVRTPAEFEQGHIPGSFNIPLLSNEERTIVGTLYKQKGKEKAFIKALEFSGPNMADFVQKAKKIATTFNVNKLLVYCWRGGMRSSSMSWLFNSAGIESYVLDGGYKNYRRHIRESFQKPIDLIVLGGYTGSGKTEILKYISNTNQVIDLEAIAHHKGSAFGFIGQEKQPTSEHFENIFGKIWLKLDFDKELWLEDESRNIGSVYLPEEIYKKIRSAQVIFIDIPIEERIKRLIREYSKFKDEYIEFALEKIKKRIGGLNYKIASEALKESNYYQVAKIALKYYDKAYSYGINKREKRSIHSINIPTDDPKHSAKIVLDFYNSFKKA